MIDVIVSGGLNLTVEDTGDIINVVVRVPAPTVIEVVVGVPTKESIVGLSKYDRPEFADVVIPSIAKESSYTASAWAWLTGLFGAVTGSVKAMLIQLVEQLSYFTDPYLLKVDIQQAVTSIELSQDKHGNAFNFKEGDKISVIIQVPDWIVPTGGRIDITINDVTSNVYNIAAAENVNRFFTAGTVYKYQYTTFNMCLVGNEVQGELFTDFKTNAGAKSFQFYTFHTAGLNASSINKITLTGSGAQIPANSIILIKRL